MVHEGSNAIVPLLMVLMLRYSREGHSPNDQRPLCLLVRATRRKLLIAKVAQICMAELQGEKVPGKLQSTLIFLYFTYGGRDGP